MASSLSLVAFERAGDPALAHHEHAVRDAQDLGQLGRDDDAGRPSAARRSISA